MIHHKQKIKLYGNTLRTPPKHASFVVHYV